MKNKITAIIIIILALLIGSFIADFDFGNNTIEIGGQEIVLK